MMGESGWISQEQDCCPVEVCVVGGGRELPFCLSLHMNNTRIFTKIDAVLPPTYKIFWVVYLGAIAFQGGVYVFGQRMIVVTFCFQVLLSVFSCGEVTETLTLAATAAQCMNTVCVSKEVREFAHRDKEEAFKESVS